MIQGYPRRPSVAPGECLVLHVSTDAPRFRVTFYRWGDGFTPMGDSPWLHGKCAAPASAGADWQWPEYEFQIPASWPSAVYVAQLQAFEVAPVLFVVRGGST